jgi:putative protease
MSPTAAKKPKTIGKISHVYDRIGVGVVKLANPLSVGDTITVKRGEQEFSQVVESIQIEHENIAKAKKGQTVGLKLAQPIKEGAVIVKQSPSATL